MVARYMSRTRPGSYSKGFREGVAQHKEAARLGRKLRSDIINVIRTDENAEVKIFAIKQLVS